MAVAVCPRSNRRHGHGSPTLGLFLGADLRIGLGTDPAASVDCLDMLAEAQAARELAGLSAADALRLLTLAGAEALGWGGEIGSLEPGKWADLCVIDLAGSGGVTDEQLAAAVLNGGADAIRATYVGGRLVFDGHG
ncbi:MAG: amidohydrolase family protein [Gemmatimonadota bacterium]|nr:MAG: amidohydrolase family protein [Gemmatimonadota bacterium]